MLFQKGEKFLDKLVHAHPNPNEEQTKCKRSVGRTERKKGDDET